MIYVDTPLDMPIDACPAHGRLGTTWAHLVTNGKVEKLHAFAAKLGLKMSRFKPEPIPHYPVTAHMAGDALARGARSITRKELCKLLMGKPKKTKLKG
jgi:hypothetical protein